MSSTYPITAPSLASAEQFLSQFLSSSKNLLNCYAGSKYEASVLIVIDLTQIAITIVQEARLSRRTPKRLIAAVTEIATTFAKLSPHQKRLAIEVIIVLVRDKVQWLATEGKNR